MKFLKHTTQTAATSNISDKQSNRLLRILAMAGLALVLVVNVVLFIKNPSDLDRFLINTILALSAYITLHVRLLSLASAGFMAIGAYSSAILTVKLGLPLALSIPGAMLVCAVVGLIIGLPVLRLSDVYLAIATLGFGEIVRIMIILTPDLTGGATGANLSTGFPYETMKQTQTWMIVAFLAVLIWVLFWLRRSRPGRAFRALRDNPRAASSLGINLVFYRNMAFVFSAVVAGAAGAFYAHSVGSIDSGDFRFGRAVDILSYAVLGGSAHWAGPILGAGVLTALPLFLREVLGSSVEAIRNFSQLPNILNGAALMLVIALLPRGLVDPLRFPDFLKLSKKPLPFIDPKTRGFSLKPSSYENGAELLEVKALAKRFGGLNAVFNVGFSLPHGTVTGLIGPNGAGKTTLVNLISGQVKPTDGVILFEGKDITNWSAHRRARAGIARTFQHIQLFHEMTVLENVVVGMHDRIHTNLFGTWLRLPSERREERTARQEALMLLHSLGLAEFARLPAGKLSYGDQRRVEIARALATRPKLLLLDEPAAGMNAAETAKLSEFILHLKKQGYSILVIEHHMDLIMGVSDHIIVLNFGQLLAQDSPEKVKNIPEVREAYLGKD